MPDAPAPAPKTATATLTPRQQAIADWHNAVTDDERKAVVEKYKGVKDADLRHIFAPAAQLGGV